MTVELILLLGIYVFIIIGLIIGDSGPLATFKKSAPRLGAHIERDISVGNGFRNSSDGKPVTWFPPDGGK
jgi:hypothetical protein